MGSLSAVAEKLAAAEAAAQAAVTTPSIPTQPNYSAYSTEPEPATADMPLTPAMAAAVTAGHAAPPAASPPAAVTKPAPGRPKGRGGIVERGLDRMAAVVFRDSMPAPPKGGPRKAVQDASMAQRTLHPVAPFRQYVTLCLRMVRVILADRGYSVFLIALPIALALLSKAIPGTKGLGEDAAGFNLESQRRLAVFIVGAAFMGVAVAIREIVGEGSIFRRERAIGLSPTAYLASKVTVFVVIDLIQVVIFVYMSMWGLPRPVEGLVLAMPLADIIIAVWLVAVASTAFALFASAVVRTAEQTTPLLVISVMFQLVLSGALFAVYSTPALKWLAILDPARWGMAASAASVRLPNLPPEIADPYWLHRQEYWWQPVGIMVLQTVVLLGLTRLVLRRFEPGRY
jgi:hypothetical protein